MCVQVTLQFIKNKILEKKVQISISLELVCSQIQMK